MNSSIDLTELELPIVNGETYDFTSSDGERPDPMTCDHVWHDFTGLGGGQTKCVKCGTLLVDRADDFEGTPIFTQLCMERGWMSIQTVVDEPVQQVLINGDPAVYYEPRDLDQVLKGARPSWWRRFKARWDPDGEDDRLST